jgi:ribosomal protein S6
MDKRPFSRVADKKFTSGFYANVIFEAEPAAIAPLRTRFAMNADVFRVLFTEAQAHPEPAAAA